MERTVHGLTVHGVDVGPETRCAHYATERDVVAIKFRCCGVYHPCHECHEAAADHRAAVWPEAEFDEHAVLCGVCGAELRIVDYLADGSSCPACGAAFNPGCRAHRDRYFATPDGT